MLDEAFKGCSHEVKDFCENAPDYRCKSWFETTVEPHVIQKCMINELDDVPRAEDYKKNDDKWSLEFTHIPTQVAGEEFDSSAVVRMLMEISIKNPRGASPPVHVVKFTSPDGDRFRAMKAFNQIISTTLDFAIDVVPFAKPV